ncbi:DUF3043 domain-containing protein [Nocardioides sp. dk4132]|uniref:DUF3043 domain-containing protein n=1 Tax=unclassified Nocardioides TaxID=2615069 RepID=UPI001295C5BF|nr:MULTISPECIES: DUF3043 domain-containing protein [unclassified Nocardioides]MQW76556.1 DUF3043 domain-containing protein [Nocardioides sp. dk4132]QGA07186.1 DUF3043 domain-containing protein [Nocardioides sp. dk884]
MFRRTKTVTVTPEPVATKPGGKGRPTPSRKEAEAAARARAKAAPRTRKEQARAQREARATSSQQVRQAMKTGDERYFMPRDKGPERRFVRDFVDSRFSFIELMIPLLIVSMILGYSGNPAMANLSSLVLMATIVLIVLDMVFLRLRLRRELDARFPNETHKGTTYYAITRALQMKFMRLPKSQVKIGQRLPDTYR